MLYDCTLMEKNKMKKKKKKKETALILLLKFSLDAYWMWALTRCWALILIFTGYQKLKNNWKMIKHYSTEAVDKVSS